MSETTNSSGSYTEPQEKKSNKTLIIIVVGLAILLVAAVVVNFIRERNIKDRNIELKGAYDKLDSISSELDSKMVEIERLGGDISELTTLKEELEAEKEELWQAKKYSDKQLRDVKERLEGYRELLAAKDTEIEELKKVNEVLLDENTDLKTERNELNQNLLEAKKTQEDLSEKVSIASKLVAENISIAAVNEKGKERPDEFRARQVNKLKVAFNIAKNDVAEPSGKEILIRIIDENDNVLFDVARGSGTFMLNGKETFFTAKQDILFDNSQQKVTFLYDKGSEYLPGIYMMEVYTEGYLMGSKSFSVK